MSFKSNLFAALVATLPFAALAGDMDHSDHMMPVVEQGNLRILDAYARVSSPVAKAGAAFLVVENTGDTDDQLIAVSSDTAQRVELHSHTMVGDGIMQMGKVEGGFTVPAHGSHALARGADHVMFMGLSQTWKDGDMIPVTLTFQNAGEASLMIRVDLERQPEDMGHSAHKDH